MSAHRIFAFSAAAWLFAIPAAHAQIASSDPAHVKAGTYKIEPYHTQVDFSVLHFGFTNFAGQFSGASGSLVLNPSKLAASKLDVSIPIASVKTTVAKLDDELKGDQWFDAAQFPDARFVSTKIMPLGHGRATITGTLTLHGVTRPLILTARFIGAGVNPLDKAYTVGFEATGTIQRSAFGVKTYVPMVGDDVRVTIAGAFEKQD